LKTFYVYETFILQPIKDLYKCCPTSNKPSRQDTLHKDVIHKCVYCKKLSNKLFYHTAKCRMLEWKWSPNRTWLIVDDTIYPVFDCGCVYSYKASIPNVYLASSSERYERCSRVTIVYNDSAYVMSHCRPRTNNGLTKY